MVTLTTIGYGDLTPGSSTSRWVNIVFVLSGVIVIAYGLGEFTEAYVSKLAENTKRRQVPFGWRGCLLRFFFWGLFCRSPLPSLLVLCAVDPWSTRC